MLYTSIFDIHYKSMTNSMKSQFTQVKLHALIDFRCSQGVVAKMAN